MDSRIFLDHEGEMFRTLQRCGVEVEEAEGRALEDRGKVRGNDVEKLPL